jgi:hypothetical protein
VRYDVYASKDGAERRVKIDLDILFKPSDEFRYGLISTWSRAFNLETATSTPSSSRT